MIWDRLGEVFLVYLFVSSLVVLFSLWRHRIVFRTEPKFRVLDLSALAGALAAQLLLFLLGFAAFLILGSLGVGAQEEAGKPVSHILEYFKPSKAVGGLAGVVIMMSGFAALFAVPFPLARRALRWGQMLAYRSSPESLAALLPQPQPASWRKALLERLNGLSWEPVSQQDRAFFHLAKGELDPLPSLGVYGKAALTEAVKSPPFGDEAKRMHAIELLLSRWPDDTTILGSIVSTIAWKTEHRLAFANSLKLGGESAGVAIARELGKILPWNTEYSERICRELPVLFFSIVDDPVPWLTRMTRSDEENIVVGALWIIRMAWEQEGFKLWSKHPTWQELVSQVKNLSQNHRARRVRKYAHEAQEKCDEQQSG